MPILSHDGGITHVYIDGDVDIPLAPEYRGEFQSAATVGRQFVGHVAGSSRHRQAGSCRR
jgi:hypothetical protein